MACPDVPKERERESTKQRYSHWLENTALVAPDASARCIHMGSSYQSMQSTAQDDSARWEQAAQR